MEILSIVVSLEKTDHRKVAQNHWGLTDEQMKGMHVHHHPPRSEGGRNIPEHLYVCSPSMHSHGWHNDDEFVKHAARGGSISRRKSTKPPKKRETAEERKARMMEWNKNRTGEKRTAETKERQSQSHLRSPKSRENIMNVNSAVWSDPQHPELGVRTISGLVRMQRKRSLPSGPENRVKVNY